MSYVWQKDAYTQGIIVNDLHCHIYCQKEGKVSCEQLPPCSNVLEQHLKRAHATKLEFEIHAWNKKPALMHIKKTVGN